MRQIAMSSSDFPAFSAASIQRGLRPRPVQVWDLLSGLAYFAFAGFLFRTAAHSDEFVEGISERLRLFLQRGKGFLLFPLLVRGDLFAHLRLESLEILQRKGIEIHFQFIAPCECDFRREICNTEGTNTRVTESESDFNCGYYLGLRLARMR